MNLIADYWNNKHPKKDIMYAGRAIRGYNQRINIDVRNMVWEDDVMLNGISSGLTGNMDQKAHWCQLFVTKNIKYIGDKEKAGIDECWQFPNETLVTRTGDCEDGAILMASLMLNAGIPNWRVRVTAGLVKAGKAAETGGHAYVTYCRESDNNWVVLDWCYLEDSNIEVKDKPIHKMKTEYKDLWFSFNNQYSWAHVNYGVIESLKV